LHSVIEVPKIAWWFVKFSRHHAIFGIRINFINIV
jgi:hypothetical protein